MPKKQTNEENKELEKLRKDIIELRENVEKNYHWELLKEWLILIGVWWGFSFVAVLLFSLIVNFASITLPEPIEPQKLLEIAPVVFTATITINGLIIGFVPLISFFFIREIRERERDLDQYWEEDKKEVKDEKLKLTNAYYNLLLMLGHNIRSGVLRYTRTFVLVSVLMQMLLPFFYIVTAGYDMAGLGSFIDLMFLYAVISGLLPILGIALYQPALKFVRYVIVEREIWRIEPED